MSQVNHSPGPWVLVTTGSKHHFSVLSKKTGDLVCTVPHSVITHERKLADGRLISAAPTLLLALEVIAKCVADEHGGVTLGSYEQDIVRAAIAKATGVKP